MSSGRRRPVHRLGDLLPGLATRLGIDSELQAARGLTSWQRIIEERVPVAAGSSELLEVRPPTLIVSAPDAAIAAELRLHTHDLLDAFASAPGGQRLLELRVVVRGPRSGGSAKPR